MTSNTEVNIHIEPQAALRELETLFLSADGDGSGAINNTELGVVMHRFYRANNHERHTVAVQNEVDQVLSTHSKKEDGTLDFCEFVELFCKDSGFKMRLSTKTKTAMLELSKKQETARLKDPGSAAARRQRWLAIQEMKSPASGLVKCDILESTRQDEPDWRTSAEPEVVARLEELERGFQDADSNGNGSLDMQELATVLKLQYRNEKVARSMTQVTKEVAAAMSVYDKDKNGSLDFREYVEMFCISEEFKFKMTQEMKQQVLELLQIKTHAENEYEEKNEWR